MRVLLVYPHFLNPRIHLEDVRPMPIGLYYIGAMLKADGFEVALLNAQDGLDVDSFDDIDERTGAQIIHRALEEPVRQIAENSGLEGSVVVNKVRELKAGEGLNAASGEYGDMVKDGVLDPTVVTRSALQNAASIAKNILTTEAIIAEMPEPAGAAGGGMPDMGGMGGMM